MLGEVPFQDFSVRELAKSLGVVPGTIYARFGTKDELLVQLYIQTMDRVADVIDGVAITPEVTVVDAVRAIAPTVGKLQRDFGTYFDAYPQGRDSVQPGTWARLQSRFQRLSRKLHATISAAAANEGVTLTGGTLAERLLWTLVTSVSRQRTATAYGHRNVNYERFVAQALVTALRTDPAPGPGSATAHRRPGTPTPAGAGPSPDGVGAGGADEPPVEGDRP